MSDFFTDIYEFYKHNWRYGNANYDVRKKLKKAEKTREEKVDPYDKDYQKLRFARREPKPLMTVMQKSINSDHWAKNLQTAQIVLKWAEIVGEANAARTKITKIEDGIIEVQCSSTAYATQLRSLRARIISTIQKEFPLANIVDITIKNPAAPTWKHGKFSVKGRGPRDTYG